MPASSQLSRRGFLATTAALAGAAMTRARASEPPPNLLFLMTDQHHHGVLGCAGNPLVKTPHIDRLAAQGVRFTNAFCPTPFCSPTRAAILTGRYPHSTKVTRNINGGDRATDDPLRLREPLRTYPHLLAEQGYHCHQLGKWHLGDPGELTCFPTGREDVERPRQMTNQRRRDAGTQARTPVPREMSRIKDVDYTPLMAPLHQQWSMDQKRSPQDLSVIGHSAWRSDLQFESVLADDCIDLLTQHRDEPFAITWSVGPPHAYWVAPSPFYQWYDPASFKLPVSWSDQPRGYENCQPARMAQLLGEDGIREYLRCYYAQVSMVDSYVGQILDALDRLDLSRRTLVIFTSDHGDMQAAHHMMGKSLPGFYDEIARVPLIARFPSVLRPGLVDSMASLVDLAPTLLDYLGAPPLAETQSSSLREVIEGRATREVIFGERGMAERGCGRMIRTNRHKLCVYANRGAELFDLKADPHELHNLAEEPRLKPVKEQLSARLKQHLEATDDPAAKVIFGAG